MPAAWPIDVVSSQPSERRRSTRRSPPCCRSASGRAPPDRRARVSSVERPAARASAIAGRRRELSGAIPSIAVDGRRRRAIARDPDLQAAAARVRRRAGRRTILSGAVAALASAADGRPLAAAADSPIDCSSRARRRPAIVATPLLLRAIANAIADVPICSAPKSCRSPMRVLQRWSRPPRRLRRCRALRPREARTTAAGSGSRRWPAGARELDAARATRLRRGTRSTRSSACRLSRRRWRLEAIVAAGSLRGARAWLVGSPRRPRWGAAAAAISPLAGALIAAARCGVALAGDLARASIVRALERAQPDARNLFVTADELRARRARRRSRRSRARVFADAAARAQRLDLRARLSGRAGRARWRCWPSLAWAAVETVASVARPSIALPAPAPRRDGRCRVARRPSAAARERHDSTAGLHRPRGDDARRSGAAAGDRGQRAGAVDRIVRRRRHVEHDGRERRSRAATSGRFGDRLRADEDRVSRWSPPTMAPGARFRSSSSPDALPAVRITAPGRDLVYARRQSAHRVRRARDRRLRPALAGAALHEGVGIGREVRVQGRRDSADASTRASARDWTRHARRGRSPSSI